MSEWQTKDKEYVANTYNRFPVEIARGEGSVVYDREGCFRRTAEKHDLCANQQELSFECIISEMRCALCESSFESRAQKR